MSTITVKTSKTSQHVCGFCSTGNRHDLCPGGILNGNQTDVVVCPCPCDTPKLRCLDCNAREDVNPDTWSCNDVEACANKRAARRAEFERTTAGRLTTTGAAKEAKKTPAKPKGGKCLCCGETTGGGLFRPGHDARYLSAAVAEIREGTHDLADVQAAWRDSGVSDALQAKLAKRVS